MTSKEYLKNDIIEYYKFDYCIKTLHVTSIYADDNELHMAFNYIKNLSFLSDAKYYLGYAYLTGRGTYKDTDMAVEYFKSAVADGDVSAMMHLGRCYMNGWGVSKNRAKGMELLKQSANNGNAEAWYFISTFCAVDIKNDSKINFEEGMEKSKLMPACLYQSLKCGIHFSNSAHRHEAFFSLLSIANGHFFHNTILDEIGSASASYYLYKIFYSGEFGFKKDVDTALKYLNKSKDGGFELALDISNDDDSDNIDYDYEDISNDDNYNNIDYEDIYDYDNDGFSIDNGTLEHYKGNSKKIIIPKSVTSIGDFAFDECASLENVTIPKSVTSIGNSAFSHCTSLKSITIPKSVTSIGDIAFFGCASLENITILNSVIYIGECAFLSCDEITIHCHKGSYAEKYARQNGIKFKLL